MNKRIFDMGSTTWTNENLPDITLDSLRQARDDFMRQSADKPEGEIKIGRWMPEGYWAVTSPHSVYLMTPRGPISWTTDDLGRVISTNPPNLLEQVQAILNSARECGETK